MFRCSTSLLFQLNCCLCFALLAFCTSGLSAQSKDLDAIKLAKINPNIPIAADFEPQLVTDSGLSIYAGKHLILFSDVRDADKAYDLVRSYDAAVPQWCEYFGVDVKQTEGWKLRAFLLQGPNQTERFEQARLFGKDLPGFAAGYQKDHNIYLYDQPGPYYTRHLLLHEGTHAFMQWFLNGYGAPWFSEGIAELLAVHQGSQKNVKLKHRLASRDDAPYWGRVKLIKDEYKAGVGMTLDDVLAIPGQAFRDVRYYAWSWAGCNFFDNHPLTQEAFNALKQSAAEPTETFNATFKEKIDPHWEQLVKDWSIFIEEMEYGLEIQRSRIIDAVQLDKANPENHHYSINAAHGWQQTRLNVKAGDRLVIHSSGRFKVGQTIVPAKVASDDLPGASGEIYPWYSESNGVTLEYYRGQPLGMLTAGVLFSDPQLEKTKGQLAWTVRSVPAGGPEREITIPSDGVLCFRINESPAKLSDNQGALDVRCKRLQ